MPRCPVPEGDAGVPEPRHSLAADRLRAVVAAALPPDLEVIRNSTVRLPDGGNPAPDLLVTTADPEFTPRGIPAALVHTVVEVIAPRGTMRGTGRYAAAGIPCHWRVELRPWWEHLCRMPAIVVRLLAEDGTWRTTLHPAGEPAVLPLMIGRHELLTVELDPAALVGRRAAAADPVPRTAAPAGPALRPPPLSARSSGAGGTCR
jgi:hypothetical protein